MDNNNAEIIKELFLDLCLLAGRYPADPDPDNVVRLYHETLMKLYALGWDERIPMECMLLHELMPEEYFKRHPEAFGYSRSEDWFRDPRKKESGEE